MRTTVRKNLTPAKFDSILREYANDAKNSPVKFIRQVQRWGKPLPNHMNTDQIAAVLIEDMVELVVTVKAALGPNIVFIAAIESRAMQQGHGRRVMQRLCELADRLKVTLALEAFPFEPRVGKPIPLSKLKQFYQSFGFKTEYSEDYGDAYMYRRMK